MKKHLKSDVPPPQEVQPVSGASTVLAKPSLPTALRIPSLAAFYALRHALDAHEGKLRQELRSLTHEQPEAYNLCLIDLDAINELRNQYHQLEHDQKDTQD